MSEFWFEKLDVWQESRLYVKLVYNLLRKFPKEEQYALCDQLRRAVTSVPSNIAEGTSRTSLKEKVHFLDIAYGSLMEVFCQIMLAYDLNYITEQELKQTRAQTIRVSILLSKLKASYCRCAENV